MLIRVFWLLTFVPFLIRLGAAQLLPDAAGPSSTILPLVTQAVGSKNVVVSTTVAPSNAAVDDSDDNDPNCANVDIRNNLNRLRQIENCTVINGFFQMVLVEKVPKEEFAKYSFSKLREVTGYMLFFRVVNLVSLRTLFPNLAVIRGQQLIGNYALVIYDMSNMIELGLKYLYAIQRGFVYTLHCPQLCHLDTIDWGVITGQDNSTKNLNSFEPPKVLCNKSEVCRGCEPKYCWGSHNCQKFYDGYNFNGRTKCHPQCLGGCNKTMETDCMVCRSWKEGPRCVEQCSDDRLQFRHSNRCITQRSCMQRGGYLHFKECLLECPAGYSTTNVDREVADFQEHRCYPCKNRCPKVCDGAEIMYLSDADRVRGCTVINGTLHIRLKEDHPKLSDELLAGLGDIEEIMGILKVFRSNFISSLDFLANLEIIHGQYTNDNSDFSLMVYENSNLQKLWNFEHKTSLRILSRGMYFRNNALLCNAHITRLQEITRYDNATDTIDWSSNGYMQACNVEYFWAHSEVLSSRNVTLYWAKYQGRTHHRLLGYLIYYIRTNVDKSPYDERDLCSKFGWKTRFLLLDNVTLYEPDKTTPFYAYNLTGLKPYTRYAFYVKTYFNESINSSTDHVGLTDMHYFKTSKDRPTSPLRMRTVRKTDQSITLGWRLLPSEQELVSQYDVDVFIEPDDPALFDQRDYCVHPHDPVAATVGLDPADHADGCSKEFCCDWLELEEEEEEEDDDGAGEVTAPDGFFGEAAHQSSEADGTARGGRRKRRAIGGDEPIHPTVRVYDAFEKSMLDLLRHNQVVPDVNQPHRHRGRMPREAEVKFVNRIAHRTFTTDNNEYTVDGLEPYKHYIFQLFACSDNDTASCSAYSLHADRTEPSPVIDRPNVTIVTETMEREGNGTTLAESLVKTTLGDRIVLHFPEPAEVNGLTVAYRVEVESVNGTHVKRWHRCITRLEHQQRHYRYTIPDVSPGEYLVRVQAVSLAGPGLHTEWMFLRVLEPPTVEQGSGGDTRLRDGLIAFAVLLIVAGFGGAGAFWWRRRANQRWGTKKQDDKIPLAEHDGNQVDPDDGFDNCSLK